MFLLEKCYFLICFNLIKNDIQKSFIEQKTSISIFFDFEEKHRFRLIVTALCFMTVKHTVSSWFNMFHGVSRPWNKMFHCWFILIQHVSSLFHRSHSSSFMPIQPVSPLFHHCFTSGNEPLRFACSSNIHTHTHTNTHNCWQFNVRYDSVGFWPKKTRCWY